EASRRKAGTDRYSADLRRPRHSEEKQVSLRSLVHSETALLARCALDSGFLLDFRPRPVGESRRQVLIFRTVLRALIISASQKNGGWVLCGRREPLVLLFFLHDTCRGRRHCRWRAQRLICRSVPG